MADDFDFVDTCLRFKRRISELSKIKTNQPTLEEQHSYSLSPEQQPSEIVSSAKEERETETGLLKKAKCGSSEPNVVVQKMQETEEDKLGFANDVVVKTKGDEGDGVVGESDCRLLREKGKELKDCELGLSGNQEFVETKKSSCSRLFVNEVQKHSAVEDWNKCLATSCVTFDENESESFLKTKEEKSLVEPAVESIADVMIHVSKFTDFQCKREIMGDAIKIRKEFDNSRRVVDEGKCGTVEIPDIDGKESVCEGMHKMAESGEKVDGLKGNGKTTKCSLKIEVIDETAVIETKVGNGIGKEKWFAKHSKRNVEKNVMKKQETNGKKEKRHQRRGKGAKKLSGTNGKEDKVLLTDTAEVQNCWEKKGDAAKRAYSRKEMEALRFLNLDAQRKMWIEVYCGLAPTVASEYGGLIDCNHQKHIRFNPDPRQQFGKKERTSGVLGVMAAKGRGNHLKISVH